MKNKYQVLTLGGVTQDIIFKTDQGDIIENKKDLLKQQLLAFERGAKYYVDEVYVVFGGGAANTAVNFSRLGFKTAVATSVGDDERAVSILKNLQSHKVLTSVINKNKDSHSGFSLVLIDQKGERTIFASRGVNNFVDLKDYQLNALNSTDLIYITSLSKNWQKTLAQVFEIKKKKPKLKIAWNPGIRELSSGVKLKKFIEQSDVFCLNKDEALELIMSFPENKKLTNVFLNKIKNLLSLIKAWCPGIVVITDGKRGAWVYDGCKFYHKGIIKENKKVDSTGLGDAFNSSFVAGLDIYKGDIDKSMLLALRNTSSLVAHYGAQQGLLSKEDI